MPVKISDKSKTVEAMVTRRIPTIEHAFQAIDVNAKKVKQVSDMLRRNMA